MVVRRERQTDASIGIVGRPAVRMEGERERDEYQTTLRCHVWMTEEKGTSFTEIGKSY